MKEKNPIKNYTSTISHEKSIMKIENMLANAGANHISKFYENNLITGVMFQLKIDDNFLSYKLPCNTKEIFEYFTAQRKKALTENQKQQLRIQALNTAWKTLQEWIHIQLSMIELKQAKPQEIFLPYMFNINSQKTLFQIVEEKKSFTKLLTQ